MADLDFNYTDNLTSSAYVQFVADQHDQAVETTGRKSYVFLLDRVDTEISDVYKEERHGRIYLPHFEQRGIYKTNQFTSSIGNDNYTEKESNLEVEYDFGRMVHNIHELKLNSTGKLTITNTSKVPLWFEIGDKLIIRNHAKVLYEKQLDGTVYSFIDAVRKEQKLIDLVYVGDSEKFGTVDRTSSKLLPRRKYEINLNNSIYENTSDVITNGTVVVTDRYRAYQVVAAYPRSDTYGRYISWFVKLELINLAKIDGLPNDFVELIKRNQYGLGKVNTL